LKFQSSHPFLLFIYFFQFLALCIEVEIIYEFGFNPRVPSNLITWSLIWRMISSTSRALAWFLWSYSEMWSISMSTRDVRINQGKLGTLWHKWVFFTICTKFDSFPIFPFESVNFFDWDMWFIEIISSYCGVNFWLQQTWL